MSSPIRELCVRFFSLFRRRKLDSDLSEEIAAHIDMAVEDNIRAGMSPDEARRRAMIRLGGVEATKERHRDARSLPLIERFVQDIRYAFRTLRHNLGFTYRPGPAGIEHPFDAGWRLEDQVFDAELLNRNTQMALFSVFAALALVLASVGLYGVLSYAVAQRTSEIGLRMALGAQRAKVVGEVVRKGLLLAALGVTLGLAGAFALTRLLSSFLYGVQPTDPATFAAVSALLLFVAILASYVPARRAANVDPVSALRAE